MRNILREKYLLPLVLLPMVIFLLSWFAAVLLSQMGILLNLNNVAWTIPVGRILVLSWVWLVSFLSIWQFTLGYLYFRFSKINSNLNI